MPPCNFHHQRHHATVPVESLWRQTGGVFAIVDTTFSGNHAGQFGGALNLGMCLGGECGITVREGSSNGDSEFLVLVSPPSIQPLLYTDV